jgi:hypothetical protein
LCKRKILILIVSFIWGKVHRFLLFAMVSWCLFLLAYYNGFATMNNSNFSRSRTRSKKVKCPQIEVFRGKIKIFATMSFQIILQIYIFYGFYPYIKSDWVVFFIIIFWILTPFRFFIILLKVNNILLKKIIF